MKTLTILLLSLTANAQTYTPTGDIILPRAQINIIAHDLKLLPYVMQDNDSLRASVIELGTMLQDAEREFEKMRVVLVEEMEKERTARAFMESYAVKVAKLEATPTYKPFGISLGAFYDVYGRPNAGVGVTWTPKILRFRL